MKLLVEHGAAINCVWNGQTPLDHAQGQPKVAKYLRSKGAKTAAEIAAETK